MRIVFWVCVALAVISLAIGVFDPNIRWLLGVSVVLALVAGALNPKGPFHGSRNSR